MSKLQVDDIVNKGDDGSVGFSKGAVVTGVTTTTTLAVVGVATAATLKVGSAITAFGGIVTATTFSGDVTGDVTGDVAGNVIGNVTGNVTGNINASSASGISTVGVLTAYSSIHINVGSGSTEVATELKTKASTGKAIAMSMVFG
tara:strand:- start:39 stop:473 length:435 start_codon:yes stop_codon:yes gene_type:complete